MSIEAMSHVLNQKVGDSTRKLVLLAYANHAHKDGTAAYCGVPAVAEYAECSTRTVQRHVPQLLADGFLREGDQRLVAHFPPHVRPIVYDVAMSSEQRDRWKADAKLGQRRSVATAQGAEGGRRAAERSAAAKAAAAGSDAAEFPQVSPGDFLTPPSGDGVSPRPGDSLTPPPGDTGDTTLVTPVTEPGDTGVTQTVLNPSREPSQEETPSSTDADAPIEGGALALVEEVVDEASAVAAGFAWFYATYPKKVGKLDAEKAYRIAVRTHSPALILAAAQRFAADPNLPDRNGDEWSKVPHPATWLNKGRFLDEEPLPVRPKRPGQLSDRGLSARTESNLSVIDAWLEQSDGGDRPALEA